MESFRGTTTVLWLEYRLHQLDPYFNSIFEFDYHKLREFVIGKGIHQWVDLPRAWTRAVFELLNTERGLARLEKESVTSSKHTDPCAPEGQLTLERMIHTGRLIDYIESAYKSLTENNHHLFRYYNYHLFDSAEHEKRCSDTNDRVRLRNGIRWKWYSSRFNNQEIIYLIFIVKFFVSLYLFSVPPFLPMQSIDGDGGSWEHIPPRIQILSYDLISSIITCLPTTAIPDKKRIDFTLELVYRIGIWTQNRAPEDSGMIVRRLRRWKREHVKTWLRIQSLDWQLRVHRIQPYPEAGWLFCH